MQTLVTRRGRKEGLNIVMFFDRGYPSGLDASIGALTEAQNHPNWNVHFFSVHFKENIGEYLGEFAREPDGILCCGWIYDSIWKLLSAQGKLGKIPMAVADFTENPACPLPENAIAVTADDARIGQAAADVFLARRFLNFAYVGGYEFSKGERHHSEARQQAFRKRVLAEGGDYCGSFQPRTENILGRERSRFAKWLSSLPKPCAVFVYNDGTAEKVLDVCKKAGLAVPEMISLLGVDNDRHSCELSTPQLSSIELDREASGRLAAEQLDGLVRGKVPRARRLLFGVRRIVERETSVDLRGGGRVVSVATRLIAERALQGLTVTQIARELRVSRGLVNLRFKEILGTTAREEILRVKFARVEQLLATTGRQCGEIARECGWQDPGVLYHLFRKRYGMSMGQWRAKRRAGSLKG